MHIGGINAESESEIYLVAQRMRASLVEVEGERTGTALYTLDWLRERVRLHFEQSAGHGESIARSRRRWRHHRPYNRQV